MSFRKLNKSGKLFLLLLDVTKKYQNENFFLINLQQPALSEFEKSMLHAQSEATVTRIAKYHIIRFIGFIN